MVVVVDIVEAEAALTVATMVDIVVEVMTDTDAPLLHITGAMITDEDPDLDHFLHVIKNFQDQLELRILNNEMPLEKNV